LFAHRVAQSERTEEQRDDRRVDAGDLKDRAGSNGGEDQSPSAVFRIWVIQYRALAAIAFEEVFNGRDVPRSDFWAPSPHNESIRVLATS